MALTAMTVSRGSRVSTVHRDFKVPRVFWVWASCLKSLISRPRRNSLHSGKAVSWRLSTVTPILSETIFMFSTTMMNKVVLVIRMSVV